MEHLVTSRDKIWYSFTRIQDMYVTDSRIRDEAIKHTADATNRETRRSVKKVLQNSQPQTARDYVWNYFWEHPEWQGTWSELQTEIESSFGKEVSETTIRNTLDSMRTLDSSVVTHRGFNSNAEKIYCVRLF